jgi:ABC-type sugar transport system ATPase subunit
VVGLVGDNGAGKTTLVGVRHAGVETVFRSLALIDTLSIAENIFLTRKRFKPGLARARWMDRRRMRADVLEGFNRLGLELPAPETKVSALSGGQRQAVAIARAVLWGSHIVLMDEPNAALGVKQTEIVLSFVEELKYHGVGVVFISHNMGQVLRVSDRIAVMRLGRKVFDGLRADLTPEDLVGLITGARRGQ